MSKDYYKILGIDKSASADEIKKAYKKAALKYHPDKQSNKSDDEKKKAEETFKEINEAYSVLSDETKKHNYDTYGNPDGPGASGSYQYSGSAADIEEMLRKAGFYFGGGFDGFPGFGGGDFYGAPQMERRGSDVMLNVSVSIEDYYKGASKKVSYAVSKRCKHCNGTGGDGIETCKTCNGSGQQTTIKNTIFGRTQMTTTCPECHGTGRTIKHKCSHCNGTGIERSTITETIDIPKGVTNGAGYSIEGKGNEHKNSSYRNGSLVVTFVHDFPSNYKLVGRNIYELVDIPYYDCLAGTVKKLRLPDGSTVDVNIPKCTTNGNQIVVPGKGVNGQYIVVVNCTMPTSVSKKEEDLLKEIQKLHS